MNALHVLKWCALVTLVAFGARIGLDNSVFASPPTPPPPAPASSGAPAPDSPAAPAAPAAMDSATAEQGVQVLTRGPVHEAFAEPVTFDPEPGVVAPKAPPAAIDEVPPAQRPEGPNIAWIPGYWTWDDERNDFVWVSGIWRDLPPGRQWEPGYWSQTAQGYQWTSGYWADAGASEVEYLPEPPATVEAGPNVAAPSPDAIWLPGCWIWQQARYAWRPGFWAAAQPDWIWVPAHYVWAPRGYVYIDGYWDYSLSRRGVLFAPVYFTAGVYARRGFSYSPTVTINLGVFANHLFVRPQYQAYYFGDYYAARYRTIGFYPAYSYNFGRIGYDPIYAHQRWQHRQDAGWDRRQEAEFANRGTHEDFRPARTWAEQRRMDVHSPQSRERGLAVGAPLDELRRNPDTRFRFQSVGPAERQRIAQQTQDFQRFRQQRQTLENNPPGGRAGTPANAFALGRVRLPGSPITARPATAFAADHIPPRANTAPKPDYRVAARPRGNRSTGPQPRDAQPARQTSPPRRTDAGDRR
jgi:hypothetical protein